VRLIQILPRPGCCHLEAVGPWHRGR
jgi:hypothetical protein